ncbi:MAG: peptidoglycan-binding protein [Candidatus Omnitrophota bacterium]
MASHKNIVLMALVIYILSGCDYYEKSKKEEEEIIGHAGGYNSKVKKIQVVLRELGFESGPIDGKLGGHTRRVIQEFQKVNNLKTNGFVDIETWSKLCGEEVSSDAIQKRLTQAVWVRKVQKALGDAGFNPGPIDGKLGPRTTKAIKKFQESMRIKPDGIVDPKTWINLYEYFSKSVPPLRNGG